MDGKITYHQQVSYCGKPRCRKCREGTGHGPYWYAYQIVNGRTVRTYIGKQLPPEIQAEIQGGLPPPPSHAVERDQAAVKIYVLGQFRLERRSARDRTFETVTDAVWQQQRVRALLACLVSSQGRRLGREQVMDMLWPDQDIETASNRLDRAVHNLRQLFEPSRSRPATSSLLLTEHEVVALAEQSRVWIDADAFEKLLARARDSDDLGEKERLLNEAWLLYGGEYLPEERRLDQVLARRESLRRSWVGMLLELSDLRARRDALATAIEPLDTLMAVDPTNEAAVQRMMNLLAQQGRRGEALRTYRNLARMLQQEYRIAPLPETRALYEAISKGLHRPGTQKGASATLSGEAGARSQDGRELAGASGRTAGQPPVVHIGRLNQSPLVGRDEEIRLLTEVVETTEQATRFKLPVQRRSFAALLDQRRPPQCVLLQGDVGMGKTRLAEEISREARRRGWTIAWSRVYALERAIPYRLWTEILRKAMEQSVWQRQKLHEHAITLQPLTTLLPDLPLPPINVPTLSPEQEQMRLWEAARELLILISEGSPLLIALDDLQWADGGSCDLLAFLARQLRGYPVVIVGTCRDKEMAPDHPLRSLITDLLRENALQTISLQPLSDEAIDAIIANVPSLPPPLARRISLRAAGNPFFAEELAHMFEALPEQDARRKQLEHVIAAPLPETVSAVLELRLGNLSEACQMLMRKAAVLGGSFSFDLINAMEAASPRSNEDLVLERLEEALRSGMLTEEGTGTRITYHFWHPLLVSHLYERLSAGRRVSLHRRAAEVLRRLYAGREEEVAAMITHHLVASGGDPELIVHYAEMAGNRAYALSTYPEAEQHYRTALEYARGLTPTTIINGRLSPAQQRIARLLELLGECVRVQGRDEESRRCYEGALDLHGLQHAFTSVEESRHEVQVQALLWCEIGFTWLNEGKTEPAEQCFRRSEEMLREAGIIAGPAWAYIRYQQSHLTGMSGAYEKAHHTAEEALRLFTEYLDEQIRHLENLSNLTLTERILAGDPVNPGRIHKILGLIANGAGRSMDAVEHWKAALGIFEQHESKRDIAIVSCNLGDVHLRRSDHTQAQASLRRALNLAEQIGEIPLIAVIFNNLGILAERMGNLKEAENWYRRGISFVEAQENPIYKSILHVYMAIVQQETGELAQARTHLCRSLSISRAIHIAPCIGLALVAAGNLRLTQAMAVSMQPESDAGEKANRFLKRAKKTLQHALALTGMEAETRTEGQLTLAQALFLLGELDEAQRLAEQTLAEARQYELTWLIARAQRVLGSMLAAGVEPGEHERRAEAMQQFELALQAFRKTRMRLEHARTLYAYGEALLRWSEHLQAGADKEQKEQWRQQGRDYLEQARAAFARCGAELDRRLAEHALARSNPQ
ncbi:MAG: tetratricopeptide repeat protein [Ktedonobacteraceae bacterium]|nr:tetratricopeptide repeat protein [Ktedonobacteraceae bacterium]